MKQDTSINLIGQLKMNKKERNVIKIGKFRVIPTIILVIFTFLYVFDVFFLKDFCEQYKNFNLNILGGFFNRSTVISQTFLAIAVSILSIFFAVYFIIVQMFKNRYPLDFIDKYFGEHLIFIATDFVSNILFGGVIFITNSELTFSKLFYIIHFIYCLYLFINTYKNYNIFNPQKIISVYKSGILKEIDCANINESLISSYLKELDGYAEESFSKNDISVSKYIIKVYKELIIHFLENRDRLILCHNGNDKDICKEKVEALEKKLFNSIIHNIKVSINYSYSNYTEETFSLIQSILEKCIDCDKIGSFINFCDTIDRLFRYCSSKAHTSGNIQIILLYGELACLVIENKCRDEWVELFIEKFKIHSIATYIHFNDMTLKALFQEYFGFLNKCTDNEKTKEYNILLNDIINALMNVSTDATSCINYIQMLFAGHTKKLVKFKNTQFLEYYLEHLHNVGQFSFNINKGLYAFILDTYKYICTNYHNTDIVKSIEQQKHEFAIEAISSNNELAVLSIPDYGDKIKTNLTNMDIITETLDKYKDLLIRCLLNSNSSMLLFILRIINSNVLMLDKSNKNCQEQFINLYKSILHFCVDIKASESFYITIEKLNELVKKLDNEDKISEQLGKDIIKLYQNISESCILEKQVEFCVNINSTLAKMPDRISIIMKKKDLYFQVIETLFQIGLDGVENNIEDIIRNISNHLGWIGKKAVENRDGEIFKDVIDKAVKLFNICLDMEVSQKTVIFIGTLFIILGGFTCSINNPISTLVILKGIEKIKSKGILNKSKMIREYESSDWNDVMKNNAKFYIDKFFQKTGIS